VSRLPVSRWTKIGVWTGAAVAWGTTLLVARQAPPAETVADTAPAEGPRAAVAGASQDAVPSLPDGGLVVLRYAPIPDPEPIVVTRYVEARTPRTATSSGGAGTVASSTPSAGPAPAPPPPAPTTVAPQPSSGGS
jgi:hypothetical protein